MLLRLTKSIVDSIGAFFIGSLAILLFYIRQHFFGHKIPNYVKVADRRLYRGGQPSKAGLKELMKHGIHTVVNLRARNRDKKRILQFSSGNMISVHVPMFPFRLQESSIIEFLQMFTKTDKKVIYVHCFHGVDRTGLMCAMYRIIFDGWDKTSAIEEMKHHGFHFWHRSFVKYIENSDIEALRKKVFS